MHKPRSEAAPLAKPIHDALARSSPLAQLRLRIDDSQRRYEAVAGSIPESLRVHLRPGPVDESGWTLLAANAAVAAKLRQMLPLLEATLRDRGWAVHNVRLKVQPPAAGRGSAQG